MLLKKNRIGDGRFLEKGATFEYRTATTKKKKKKKPRTAWKQGISLPGEAAKGTGMKLGRRTKKSHQIR